MTPYRRIMLQLVGAVLVAAALGSTAYAKPLSITTNSLPSGQIDVAYNQTVAATGGTLPYSWSIASGALPAGLSIVAGTGVISGTPTTAGTSSFTVRVTDGVSATATQALSIVIPVDLSITTAGLADGQIGVRLPADARRGRWSDALCLGGHLRQPAQRPVAQRIDGRHQRLAYGGRDVQLHDPRHRRSNA